MTIVDYNLKLEKAIDFYNQAISALKSVHNSIAGFQSIYNFDILNGTLDESTKNNYFIDIEDEVEKAKKQLLIELGRVGEYAMKYLLTLTQMNDYPDQSYEVFCNKKIFSLADKKVGDTYVADYQMNPSTVLAAQNAQASHRFQTLHDYAYLYELLTILHPEIINNIHKVLEMQVRQDLIANSDLPDQIKDYFVIFPDKNILRITDLSEEDFQKYKDKFDKIIQDSGDVFGRLRYLENNTDNKQYNLNEILYMLNKLIHFLQLVHDNQDNYSFNPINTFRKDSMLRVLSDQIKDCAPEKNRFQFYQEAMEEERKYLDDLFSIDRVREDLNLQEVSYKTGLSVEEIRKLCMTDYSNESLYGIIYNGITKEDLDYFKEKGLTSVPEIIRIVRRNILGREELKELDLDKEDLELLTCLDISTFKYLKQNPLMYDFFRNNKNALDLIFRNYNPEHKEFEIFKEYLSMDEFRDNPYLFYLLDSNQMSIYEDLNEQELTREDKIQNIKDNVREFSGKRILRKLPILLSAENNKRVIELLEENGLEESMMDKIDSTIFCIPSEMLSIIISRMNDMDIPFIENGEMNSIVFNILEELRKDKSIGIRPLPIRHFKISDVIDFDEAKKEPEEEAIQFSS